MHYQFFPSNVCSRQIDLDIENGKVYNLRYTGGCNGNLKALGAMCEGVEVDEVIRRLDGITCGENFTSCSDQLARSLKSISK